MTLEDIYANLETLAESGCLVWTRHVNSKGYGRVRFNGDMKLVHRIVWEAVNGPIPADRELDHLCRVRSCANVDHLELVTHRENTLRGESFTARQARQTHCIHGHELSGENLYPPSLSKLVYRRCRICKNAVSRRCKARRRAAHTIQGAV